MSLLFMIVFAVKMSISLAPLITFLDSGTAKAVIMQLELENKGEKKNADKEK